ncbi:MAG: hypothetical protein AAGA48_40050 [Myxococcota bacterium]
MWPFVSFVLPVVVGCEIDRFEPVGMALPPIEGTGDYEFASYEPLASKPLRVFFHVPRSTRDDSPVVIVMHGQNRDADAYRDTWIPLAETFGFVVAAPQFRDVFYAGSNGYALGNVFRDGENPSPETERDSSEWSYQWLEPLFDDIVARTPTEVETYQAWGHSAGAQFLHRFVMFISDARYDYVVAANAGWYTMPDDAVPFPYGLGDSPIEGGDRSFFSRDLIVHNGDNDDNPQSSSLRRTPEADEQGLHRLDRGAYFVEQSAQLAGDGPFAWAREVVPGVGHSQEGMAPVGARWLANMLEL